MRMKHFTYKSVIASPFWPVIPEEYTHTKQAYRAFMKEIEIKCAKAADKFLDESGRFSPGYFIFNVSSDKEVELLTTARMYDDSHLIAEAFVGYSPYVHDIAIFCVECGLHDYYVAKDLNVNRTNRIPLKRS